MHNEEKSKAMLRSIFGGTNGVPGPWTGLDRVSELYHVLRQVVASGQLPEEGRVVDRRLRSTHFCHI